MPACIFLVSRLTNSAVSSVAGSLGSVRHKKNAKELAEEVQRRNDEKQQEIEAKLKEQQAKTATLKAATLTKRGMDMSAYMPMAQVVPSAPPALPPKAPHLKPKNEPLPAIPPPAPPKPVQAEPEPVSLGSSIKQPSRTSSVREDETGFVTREQKERLLKAAFQAEFDKNAAAQPIIVNDKPVPSQGQREKLLAQAKQHEESLESSDDQDSFAPLPTMTQKELLAKAVLEQSASPATAAPIDTTGLTETPSMLQREQLLKQAISMTQSIRKKEEYVAPAATVLAPIKPEPVVRLKGVFRFTAQDEDQINVAGAIVCCCFGGRGFTRLLLFLVGDEFTLLDDSDTWWQVKNAQGEVGFVPSNYVERIG